MITEQRNNLDSEQSLQLFEQGFEAWNAYMEAHGTTDVRFGKSLDNGNFSQFIFNGQADFSHVVFTDIANFSDCSFKETAIFDDTVFREAAIFSNTNFNGRVLFSYSVFNGLAHFDNSIFKERVEFDNVTCANNLVFRDTYFNQEAYFDHSSFSQQVSFRRAIFNGPCTFSHATFDTTTFFTGAKFNDANFDGSLFKKLPRFYEATFTQVPDFSGSIIPSDFIFALNINYKISPLKRWWELNKASEQLDTLKYRLLKQHAINAKDHDMEQQFFSWEMMAKRWYSINDPLSITLSFLYQWFSNFGFSIGRPIFWFIVLCSSCSYSYYTLSQSKNYGDAIIYSLSNILPFGVLGKNSIAYHKSLFHSGLPWASEGSWQFYLTLFSNNILGFILLFLIALGLRNRFRL